MSNNKVEIRYADDESFEVTVNGKYVCSANHDEHGWSGMGAIEDAIKRYAKIVGDKVKVVEGPGDE